MLIDKDKASKIRSVTYIRLAILVYYIITRISTLNASVAEWFSNNHYQA